MIRASRPCLVAALAVALFAAFAAPALAQKAQEPVLVTSCGQTLAPTMIGLFMKRVGIDYDVKSEATVKDLAAKPYKTIVITTGSSLKGMGAAGVEITDEVARANALIAEAKKRGITVVGAHVEGMERRARNAAPGDNSDEMSIDAVCPKAAFLIVRKDGDEDGRFTALGKKFNIPVLVFQKNADIVNVLKPVFGK